MWCFHLCSFSRHFYFHFPSYSKVLLFTLSHSDWFSFSSSWRDFLSHAPPHKLTSFFFNLITVLLMSDGGLLAISVCLLQACNWLLSASCYRQSLEQLQPLVRAQPLLHSGKKNITRVISLLHEPLPFIDKCYNHPGYRICSSLQRRTRTTQSEVASDETNNAPLTKTTLGAAGRGSGPNVPCYSLPFALSPSVDAPRTIKPFGRSAWQRTSIYIRTVLPNLNFNVYWLSKPHEIGFHDAMISLEKKFY